MRRFRVFPALLALIVVLASGPGWASSTASAAAPSTTFYVESTGHMLGDPFLSYWVQHDGQRTLGNPVTEVVGHDNGRAQYFEFGVLVEDVSGSMARAEAGDALLQRRHSPDDQSSSSRRVGTQPRTTGGYEPVAVQLTYSSIEPERAYAIDGEIRQFYLEFGGKGYFGKPLSNAFALGDRTVQWFEYGRIEIDSDGPRLAAVGLELAWSMGLDTSAIHRGEALAFDPDRYRRFTGDGTIENADGVFIPTRIMIPKLRVDSAIESVKVENGVMGTPKNAWNVGWYPSMASPGEYTNVVMAGHRDWFGVGPVVFWNLNKLVPGDKIYVTGPDGAGATYVVNSGWLVDAGIDARELISDTGYEALTLITCGGTWNGKEYLSRYVIRAERI
jgi:LPXTG-site transpeptidase (sortase) family protein